MSRRLTDAELAAVEDLGYSGLPLDPADLAELPAVALDIVASLQAEAASLAAARAEAYLRLVRCLRHWYRPDDDSQSLLPALRRAGDWVGDSGYWGALARQAFATAGRFPDLLITTDEEA